MIYYLVHTQPLDAPLLKAWLQTLHLQQQFSQIQIRLILIDQLIQKVQHVLLFFRSTQQSELARLKLKSLTEGNILVVKDEKSLLKSLKRLIKKSTTKNDLTQQNLVKQFNQISLKANSSMQQLRKRIETKIKLKRQLKKIETQRSQDKQTLFLKARSQAVEYMHQMRQKISKLKMLEEVKKKRESEAEQKSLMEQIQKNNQKNQLKRMKIQQNIKSIQDRQKKRLTQIKQGRTKLKKQSRVEVSLPAVHSPQPHPIIQKQKYDLQSLKQHLRKLEQLKQTKMLKQLQKKMDIQKSTSFLKEKSKMWRILQQQEQQKSQQEKQQKLLKRQRLVKQKLYADMVLKNLNEQKKTQAENLQQNKQMKVNE